MIFWGKVVGFLLGWLVLGPIGGLIGFIVGSMFDRGLNAHLHQIPRNHTAEVQQAFFTATFSVMGHLAKSDGRVSKDEIRVAEHIMDRLELDQDLRKEAIRLFNQGKDYRHNLEHHLNVLYQECQDYPDLLRFFIEIQLEAALADGPLQPEEQQILLLICQRLRVSPLEFEQLMARQWASQAFHQWYSAYTGQSSDNRQYQQERTYSHRANEQYSYQQHSRQRQSTSSLHDAYGVLGISSNATQAEIKKAYRILMNQHHPDKLVSRGLPEGMIKLAQEKTQQIRAAYDLIREARGFR